MKQIRQWPPPSLNFPIQYLLPTDDSVVRWGRLNKSAIEQIKTYAVYSINETFQRKEAIFLKSYFTQKSQKLLCLPATTTISLKA